MINQSRFTQTHFCPQLAGKLIDGEPYQWTYQNQTQQTENSLTLQMNQEQKQIDELEKKQEQYIQQKSLENSNFEQNDFKNILNERNFADNYVPSSPISPQKRNLTPQKSRYLNYLINSPPSTPPNYLSQSNSLQTLHSNKQQTLQQQKQINIVSQSQQSRIVQSQESLSTTLPSLFHSSQQLSQQGKSSQQNSKTFLSQTLNPSSKSQISSSSINQESSLNPTKKSMMQQSLSSPNLFQYQIKDVITSSSLQQSISQQESQPQPTQIQLIQNEILNEQQQKDEETQKQQLQDEFKVHKSFSCFTLFNQRSNSVGRQQLSSTFSSISPSPQSTYPSSQTQYQSQLREIREREVDQTVKLYSAFSYTSQYSLSSSMYNQKSLYFGDREGRVIMRNKRIAKIKKEKEQEMEQEMKEEMENKEKQTNMKQNEINKENKDNNYQYEMFDLKNKYGLFGQHIIKTLIKGSDVHLTEDGIIFIEVFDQDQGYSERNESENQQKEEDQPQNFTNSNENNTIENQQDKQNHHQQNEHQQEFSTNVQEMKKIIKSLQNSGRESGQRYTTPIDPCQFFNNKRITQIDFSSPSYICFFDANGSVHIMKTHNKNRNVDESILLNENDLVQYDKNNQDDEIDKEKNDKINNSIDINQKLKEETFKSEIQTIASSPPRQHFISIISKLQQILLQQQTQNQQNYHIQNKDRIKSIKSQVDLKEKTTKITTKLQEKGRSYSVGNLKQSLVANQEQELSNQLQKNTIKIIKFGWSPFQFFINYEENEGV